MSSPPIKRKETSYSMRSGRRSSASRPNKVGLAKLAKTRSLSSSTGNLSETEGTFLQYSGSGADKATKPKACVLTNPPPPPTTLTSAKPPSTPLLKKAPSSLPKIPPPSPSCCGNKPTKKVSRQERVVLLSSKSYSSPQLSTAASVGSNISDNLHGVVGVPEGSEHLIPQVYNSSETAPLKNTASHAPGIKTDDNRRTEKSPKAAHFFVPNEPDDVDDDDDDVGENFESLKSSGRRSRLSKAPLASFDDSFDNETSSESHECRSIVAPTPLSAKKTAPGKFSTQEKSVNSLPGVHSHGDLVDYALLHRKRSSELESTGLLNRHIGSIRRFLGRTSASAHASPDRASPVIKLSEAKEEAPEGGLKRRSTRRRLSGESGTAPNAPAKELTVPTSLFRSNSLNMLSEAFSAVHNLCVVPANAGTTAQEQSRRRSCSVSPAQSCSPALSSSPPASCSPSSLNVASGPPQEGVWFPHNPQCGVRHKAPLSSINNPGFESHSPSYARSPARSDSRISSSNVDGASLITNSGELRMGEVDQNGKFIVANINGDQPILLPKSPLAYNEFPVTTGHTKFNFSEKKIKLRKKKKALGDTLKRLRGGSVSPSSSVHSSRENSSSVSLDTTPPSDIDLSTASVDRNSTGRNSNSSTVNSTPSKSSCGMSSSGSTVNSTPSKSGDSSSQSLPILMAQPDRCGCSQPTPSLSRSSAFRDSRRNMAPSPVDVPTCDVSKSAQSSSDPTPSDQSLSSSACTSVSVQSSLVSSNSSGRSTVVHNVLGSSSSGHDSLVSHFSSALSDESLRSNGHERSSAGGSDSNVNMCDKSKSPKHRPKPDLVATPTKKRAVRCSSSPPVTVKEQPQVVPKSFGSLQSLEEGAVDDENEVKLRSKESRRNRKDRVNRNRNAQIFHSKRHNGVDPQVSGANDAHKNLTKEASDQSGAVISTPSSGYHSSCSSTAALPASASCQEIPAILRTKKAGLERTGRPQSWGSGNMSSLPGVAAAIGTMMANASGTATPQESPCQSPAMLSPSGSLERLDLEEDLEDDEPPATSATAAILGAINTSEMRARKISICTPEMMARSYLYGGLDFLLGPRELDRCLPERSITVFIATWNMNGKEPPSILDHLQLGQELEEVPDMYVVGTQESGVERRAWEVRLQACVGQQHVLLTSAALGILHLNIFVRRDLIWFFSTPEEGYHSLRPGTYFKTKGATAICFQFFGTRFLFVNSHLFAHEEKYAQRIQNIKNISHALDLPRSLPVKHKYKDATKRFDCVFWLGDLNFRLVANRDHVLEKISAGLDGPGTVQHLLQWDQLSCARKKGETFVDFEEGEITFAPTFKYDPGTDSYDSSSKQRVPSYTDRILFKSPRSSITCLEYDSSPMFRSSDHKPVWGRYRCQIRPGKDDVPLNAGQFNREVYLDALKRRRKVQHQLMRGGEEPEGGCSLQ